jgi:DNA-binding MarR family transcriptional regulator
MGQAKTLYAIIRTIRAGFHLLKNTGDALHENIGVTSAMRAVMESLADHGAETVPDIARRKHVTRQHIQTLADQLAEDGLVRFTSNPAHKRSNLVQLSAKGEKTFAAMRAREANVLKDLAKQIPQADLETTFKTLSHLNTLLESHLQHGETA